jgi:hypothetical protein
MDFVPLIWCVTYNSNAGIKCYINENVRKIEKERREYTVKKAIIANARLESKERHEILLKKKNKTLRAS